ncbi:MAG TPA: alkaline phytoceramidase [Parasulfuritortus sp.]
MMKRLLTHLPMLLTVLVALAMLAYGPIPQLPHYHAFADQRVWLGLPHAADVLSNIGFALVGVWGLLALWPKRRHPALASGWPGYVLFLSALVLTAIGSSYYHLAPDDTRLVWDRLPIVLACAGLLAAVRAEGRPGAGDWPRLLLLAAGAVASVWWWRFTGRHGVGDLRPYLLLQGLPLVLIPLWQAIYGAPARDRAAFGLALGCYVLAKFAELYDHEIMAILGVVSGHTLKHLFATAAAFLLTRRLVVRVGEAPSASAGYGTRISGIVR